MSHIANRATSNPNKQVKKNLFKTEIRPALFYLSNRIIWILVRLLCDEFQHKYSEVRMPDAGIKVSNRNSPPTSMTLSGLES